MISYQVSVSDYSCVVRGEFRCTRCGHQDEYHFPVTTQGQATVGATSRDSSEVAVERAKKIASKLSQQTITTLTCPRCHEMNPGAVGRFLRAQAPVAIIFSILFGGGAALVAGARGGSPVLWGLLTFVVTAVLLCVVGFRAARGRDVTFASSGARVSGAR